MPAGFLSCSANGTHWSKTARQESGTAIFYFLAVLSIVAVEPLAATMEILALVTGRSVPRFRMRPLRSKHSIFNRTVIMGSGWWYTFVSSAPREVAATSGYEFGDKIIFLCYSSSSFISL